MKGCEKEAGMKTIARLLLAGLLMSPLPARTAPQVQPTDVPSAMALSEAFHLAPVRVILRDQRVLEGRLLGLAGSGIVLRVGGRTRAIEKDEISALTIEKNIGKASPLVTGAVLGAYLLRTPFFGRYRPTPFFIDSHSWTSEALTLALRAGTGMALGWAVDALFRRKTKAFFTPGGGPLSNEQWERLLSLLAARKMSRIRWHLTFDAGRVFACAVSDSVPNAGNCEVLPESSSFNMLRRLRIEYSISPSWQLGYAYVLLGEPETIAIELSDGDDFHRTDVSQTSRGHYLTAAFQPLARRGDSGIWIASLGLGAGLAQLKLHRNTSASLKISGTYFYYDSNMVVAKTVPSFLAFAELRYQIFRHLALGVSADWTWAPAQELAAFAEAGIGARRISFSSGSLGFSLGLHL
jgi:hypothetical protein